nr:retrovirus-related Pol polyprotein from transposon TNT 1-94 [Tanacetum cinerariifolium]
MIAFLTKSNASEGFDQIVDFLTAHPIQYALMVNPTIYASCIKQFWASVLIKKSNDAVKLQALIDRKKVIIIEDTIRQAFRLDDVDGIDYLPNEEIFAELARMGYEKPSTKLVRNVDRPSKFIMYPQFLQVMINALVDDLSSHNTKYTSPALTHKVFANMRRIGKGFLGVETPLFDAMLVPQQVQADVAEVEEVEDEDNETCASLTKKLSNLEQDKIAQALAIVKLKQRVRRLEKKRRTKHSSLKRLKKGRMEESQAKAYHLDFQHAKKVLKQVKRKEQQDNTVTRYQALKRKPLTKAQARKSMMIYLKNMARFKMDFFKEGSKRKGERFEQDTTKKQRIDKEVEELKTHLQIIINDDDDVYTKATPLASKVPVVDYQIHHENNKPYYKITRADGTHKLFLSFITLLNNFNREDLEALWKLVKERFKSTEPKNFSDDFLLNTFKIIFKKPNVEANVWRDQKGKYGLAKVKSWKMFESCGVHIITLTTTQLILLVEKKYPLTHFTLEQMLNNLLLSVQSVSAVQLVSTAIVIVNTVSSKWGYARSGIDHYAYSCDELALIHYIFIAGYDVNGRPRIKGTSLSSEAQISLMMVEFSSCLLANFAINLDSDSSIMSLRGGRLLKSYLLPQVDNLLNSEWGYAGSGINHYVYSCDELALIRHLDYAGYNMDRKITSCAYQILRKLVCWSAKKQQSVAMSSAEAEYVAAVGRSANILWMKS